MSPFFECSAVIAIVILLMVFVGAPVGRRFKQWVNTNGDDILDDIFTGIFVIAITVVGAILLATVLTAVVFGIFSGIEQIIELF